MAQRGTWKIEVAGQEIPLADFTDAVHGESRGGGKNFQTVTGYGAADEKYIDLGNRHHPYKFTMQREHPDNITSTSWYLADAIAYEGVADVMLTHIDYSGNEAEFLIAGAKVEITVDEPIGVSTTTHITITGGIAVLQP